MVILHRYLGIAIGLLMAMWFASGIVFTSPAQRTM
jgi:hypothetical protein